MIFRKEYSNLWQSVSIFPLLVVLGVLSCSKSLRVRPPANGQVVKDWTVAGGDFGRTGYRNATLPQHLLQTWTHKTTSAVGPTLVVADGLVYVPTLDGRLDVVDVRSGDRIGRQKLAGNLEATSVYSQGNLFIAYRYGDKTLASYDLSKGSYNWQIDAGDIASEPLITPDGLFVSAQYRHLDRYDPATGEKQWTFETADQHRSSPAISGSTVVAGCDNGTIYALDAETGSLKWEASATAAVLATPALSEGRVLVGSLDSTFYAFDLEDGSKLWQFAGEAPFYQSAATDGRLVVVGTSSGQLYCLDSATGDQVWRFEATSGVSTAPLIAGGAVYFGTLGKLYYGLDLTDGTQLWQFTTRGRIRTAPVLWGDYLLGASEDKYVYAFSKHAPKAVADKSN